MSALLPLQTALEGIPNHPEQDEEEGRVIEDDKSKQFDQDFLKANKIRLEG